MNVLLSWQVSVIVDFLIFAWSRQGKLTFPCYSSSSLFFFDTKVIAPLGIGFSLVTVTQLGFHSSSAMTP